MTEEKRTRITEGDVVEQYVCQCDCGGEVWGVQSFGQLWTWCDQCSPVQTVNLSKLNKQAVTP